MNIKFKQIESTFWNVVLIILVIAAGTISSAAMEGGVHGLDELSKAASHGLILGVCMAAGWLAMKSPLAGQVRTLLGTEKVTEPSGKVTETTVAVTEPLPVKEPQK